MIEVAVYDEEAKVSYGVCRFIELPRPGDRIVVNDALGINIVRSVDYVQHQPVRIPPRPLAGSEPSLSVIVRYHSSLFY